MLLGSDCGKHGTKIQMNDTEGTVQVPLFLYLRYLAIFVQNVAYQLIMKSNVTVIVKYNVYLYYVQCSE